MQEIVPLIVGAVIGLLVSRVPGNGLRAGLFVVLCLAAGAAVSHAFGELEVWWGFFTFDAALVWLGGLIAVSLMEWRRRSVARA